MFQVSVKKLILLLYGDVCCTYLDGCCFRSQCLVFSFCLICPVRFWILCITVFPFSSFFFFIPFEVQWWSMQMSKDHDVLIVSLFGDKLAYFTLIKILCSEISVHIGDSVLRGTALGGGLLLPLPSPCWLLDFELSRLYNFVEVNFLLFTVDGSFCPSQFCCHSVPK